MKIDIKVFPRAKKNQIVREKETFKIYLVAPAVDGKANAALVEMLAEYYKVKKRQVEITKGLKSRYKTITILGIDQ